MKDSRTNFKRRLGLALVSLALAVLTSWLVVPRSFWSWLEPTASAATFTVINTNDSGGGSLRQAILDANANPGADTITFTPGLSGTIALSTGVLQISQSVDINGPGANILSVSGTSGSFRTRVFEINAGVTATISGLTIHRGSTTGPFFGTGSGGGIANLGTLTLNDCVVSDNRSRGGQNPVGGGIVGDAFGGGIVNSGTLTLKNCVVRDNVVVGGSAFGAGIAAPPNVTSTLILNKTTVSGNVAVGVPASGGGISINSASTATINNCTISGNLVALTNAVNATGTASGGGIANAGTLTVNNSTITANIATGTGASGQGGGIAISAGAVTLRSTIVAQNSANASGKDVQGALAPAGSFNLIGDGAGMTGLTDGTNNNQVGTGTAPINPLLGALHANGGPTPTHALHNGSPAIDKGTANGFTTDQRGIGFPRVFNDPAITNADDGADIGAFEVQTAGGDPCSTVVINTNDSGAGSLREAINCSNSASGLQTISFAIPGAGPHTISPTNPLPPITDPATVDGYSQLGSSLNTLPEGTNAILQIVVSYANVPASSPFDEADKPELIRDGESVFDVQSGGAAGSSGTILRGLVIQPGTSLITGRNQRQGIFLRGAGGHTVEGCFIGTNVDGTAAAASNTEQTAVYILSDGNTVGGATVGARNLIGGNGVGVRVGRHGNLNALQAAGTMIQNNLIGANAAGTAAIANGPGIMVVAATGTRIVDNMISGNTLPVPGLENSFVNETAGVVIVPFNASGFTLLNFFAATDDDELRGNVADTEIRGNRVGTSVSGDSALPNTAGIWISGFSPIRRGNDGVVDVRIGTPQAGNLISGNSQGGIFAPDTSTADSGFSIRNNRIGTNAAGTSAVPNGSGANPLFGGDGIDIFDSFNGVQIGGVGQDEGNLISGNARHGVHLVGGFSGLQGNRIGTNAAGTAAIANGVDGVRIENSALITIGGTSAAARNLISGNGGNGVSFVGAAATGAHVLQGNYIGTDVTGMLNLGNALDGVFISGGQNFNTIGGQISGGGPGGGTGAGANLIAFNSRDGVRVEGNSAIKNLIGYNSIFSNTGLGINLGADGVTPNDAGDLDTGPNNLQNFPVLTSAVTNGATTTIQGTVNSLASQQYTIQFFSNAACDASGNGEGKTWLADLVVTTDGSGNATINAMLPMAVQLGQVITATAINTDTASPEFQNTSEFSMCRVVTQASLVVNSTNDPGTGVCDSAECTLREAINAANANLGADIIAFNIPGAGPHTISPGSGLPGITEQVTIDGLTQPGATCGAWPPMLKIVLSGNNAGTSARGLIFTNTADNSTVRGLVINQFSLTGIQIGFDVGVGSGGLSNVVVQCNLIGTDVTGTLDLGNGIGVSIGGSTGCLIGGTAVGARNLISGNGSGVDLTNSSSAANNRLEGNFIGTDVTGTLDLGNSGDGVRIFLSPLGGTVTSYVIGGTTPEARNIISGNDQNGISTNFAGFNPGPIIQGNFVGTDVTGTARLGNSANGISLDSSNLTSIGGTTASTRNVISANGGAGVKIGGVFVAGFNRVQGNYIGTDASGTSNLSNGLDGVLIVDSPFSGSTFNTIGGQISGGGPGGGTGAGANLIAFNSRDGVRVEGNLSRQNLIGYNSIFGNTGLGINLGTDGVTPNDAGDPDTGPNNLQNFPVLASAVTDGATTTIQGTFNSLASQQYTIQFFSNAACNASGNGEGETWLADLVVMTEGSGNATINTTLPMAVPLGQVITATAINTDTVNPEFQNSSEFSMCQVVTSNQCTLTCPSNIAMSNTPGQCGAVVNYPAPATTDDCGTVSCAPASGSFFPVGTTTVNCTTTAGPSCSFTVTVTDTQAPTIACPANINAAASPGQTCAAVTFTAPVASDNCSGVTTMCVPPPGTCFPLGTTTVSCTATDAANNMASCSFAVNVSVFDFCIQDDSDRSRVLMFSSITGDYLFCCGGSVRASGRGTVKKKGGDITLRDNPADRRVLAKVSSAARRGTASLQMPPGRIRCTITDRDITNNTCNCTAP